MMYKGRVTIGKIVNTHGCRGMVKVLPLTDFPERFSRLKQVTVAVGGNVKILNVESGFYHKKYFVVKFVEVKDMDEALKLKGALLQVEREDAMPLPEDTFYIFDIVGLKVYSTGGQFLGRVTDVLQTGANDVYVVEGEHPRPVLVPALKQVVKRVDVAAGVMEVELPAGLLD